MPTVARHARDIRAELLSLQGTPALQNLQESFRQSIDLGLDAASFVDAWVQIITFCEFLRAIDLRAWQEVLLFQKLEQLLNLSKSLGRVGSFLDATKVILKKGFANAEVEKELRDNPENVVTRCYEVFLGEYDKATRETLGTYYTPASAVDFIVKSVDALLQEQFALGDGILGENVHVLDPASGTNIFLTRAMRWAFATTCGRWAAAPNLVAGFLKKYRLCEVQPAALVIGMLNGLALLCAAQPSLISGKVPWASVLKDTLGQFEEELQALSVKKDEKCIPVVWGNPPYKKDAKTESPALAEAMKTYQVPVRNEKSLRVLSDYYVKFLRFAHERVHRAGQGIVALVLNSSYIDGPVHRGLRASLIADFSKIYALNLHGAIQPPEVTPPGVEDANIFDIKTGVSILLCVKGGHHPPPCLEVHYADVWGNREEKLAFLSTHDVSNIEWKRFPTTRWGANFNQFSLAGVAPVLIDLYASGISIRNLFRRMVMGVTTGNDAVLIDFTREGLVAKISERREELDLNPDVSESEIDSYVIPYNYRALDVRALFYKAGVVNRDRREVMQNLTGPERVPDNAAIVTERFIRAAKTPAWNFIYVSEIVPDKSCISNQDNSHVYPLFIRSALGPESNLRKEVGAFLSKQYGWEVTANLVFHYILALLSTPRYQATFSTLLGLDYPGVIFPQDGGPFLQLAALGHELREALAFKLENAQSVFQSKSGCEEDCTYEVESVRYDASGKKAWYNAAEFIPISPEAWEAYIGYFRPLPHFLSSREGRALDEAERAHVGRLVQSMEAIITLRPKLDAAYGGITGILNSAPLLTSIIRGELGRTRRLPIPGLGPSAADLERVRRVLYLPDEGALEQALK